MCNDHDHFADLKDLEEDIWDAPVDLSKVRAPNQHVELIGNVAIPGFVENCPKCRGTGNFVSYSGRVVGACFHCKGEGKLQFRTSPAARAKARVASAARKVKSKADNIAAFKAEFPVEAQWLISHSDGNTFADSLRQAVEKYGRLTDGQLAAVRRGIARDDERGIAFETWCAAYEGVLEWLTRESEAGNEFAGSLLDAGRRFGSLTSGQLRAVQRNLERATDTTEGDLDISSLKGYYAVPNGDTRLKICVRKPGANSKYHGWTFVDDGAAYGNRQTYGRQAPGGTYKGRIQDALRAILADPREAQVAYGKLTGVCGVCGRILEDEASVAAGIGPICASKY